MDAGDCEVKAAIYNPLDRGVARGCSTLAQIVSSRRIDGGEDRFSFLAPDRGDPTAIEFTEYELLVVEARFRSWASQYDIQIVVAQ